MKIKIRRSQIAERLEIFDADESPASALADADMARDIAADAEHNLWAWCDVRLRLTFDEITVTEYLGSCSYENEAGFRADPYYAEMRRAAERLLLERVTAFVQRLGLNVTSVAIVD